ncbi:MAG: hypothetical protein CMP98_06440 [Gammaproteobacteria bacterium]|nr:hypothetical protein [Gammaproteobacteria bacterium]OUU09793.1 MAG: hypothetical protein CBB94_06600 [Gammaproteobacteria bacterium TMED34]
MAAGEYVSGSSPADTERADIEVERKALEEDEEVEKQELAGIYVSRGLEPALAKQVAEQLMNHDALGAHARDEIGISESIVARPIQAALSSASAFTIGAMLPLLVAWVTVGPQQVPAVVIASLVLLAMLGGLAARTGGAPVGIGVLRVTFWGAMAMAATAGIGRLFDVIHW